MLIFFIGFILFWIIDWGSWRLSNKSLQKKLLFKFLFWGSSIFLSIFYIFSSVKYFQTIGQFRPSVFFINYALFLLLPKLCFIILSLIYKSVFFFILKPNSTTDSSRRYFVALSMWGVSTIPLFYISKGILVGRYNFVVSQIELFFEDLPSAFDGFTIVQFSDFHAGSIAGSLNNEYLKAFELIQEQEADMLVFTGDWVNYTSQEFTKKWILDFRDLKANYGKYAVLGNHDYGEYKIWNTQTEKIIDGQILRNKIKQTGFDLLCNTNRTINKQGQSIYLLGVENWGKAPFPQLGDLSTALQNTPANSFKVLLSHDPSHFDEIVSTFPKKIHLTLSGHTHGFQFGVKLPWSSNIWSPIQYRYPRWKGLYKENERYLYVNTGLGTLGFNGRINMPPEISKIILKQKK